MMRDRETFLSILWNIWLLLDSVFISNWRVAVSVLILLRRLWIKLVFLLYFKLVKSYCFHIDNDVKSLKIHIPKKNTHTQLKKIVLNSKSVDPSFGSCILSLWIVDKSKAKRFLIKSYRCQSTSIPP